MLKHHFIKPLFRLLFLLTIALASFGEITWWWLLLPIILYLILIAVGSYFIRLNYYLLAFNRANISSKKIALTFDDGPIKNNTETLLQLLAKRNVKASFFLIGKNIAGNENIVQQIHQSGHLIGCHSYIHSNTFPFFRLEKMKADIMQGKQEIARAIGVDTHYFRPPFGVTNPVIAKTVTQLKLQVIGWSVRTYDTNVSDEKILLKRLYKAKEGDIVLLHDWGKYTLQALSKFIDAYQSKGFEFVRVDELN